VRILGLADLHIGATHLTSLEEQEAALREVVAIAKREQVHMVTIAGDATHHAHANPRALALLGNFFTELDQSAISVVITAGNHDPQIPAIAQHFRGRVHVALEPRLITTPYLDIACLPYLPDAYVRAQAGGGATKEEVARLLTLAAEDILRGFLAQRRPEVSMVLVAHGTIAGTSTATGFSMGWLPGTEWKISPETAAEFDVAFIGHIHLGQEPAPNVIVPGSMLPLDFAETERKRVVVAEVPDANQSPRRPMTWKSIPLETAPTVATIAIETRAEVEIVVKYPSTIPARKLRVLYRADEALAREYPPSRISAALYAAGASLVQVELDVERPDRARDASVTAALTPLGALERYLDGREDLEDVGRTVISEKGALAVDLLRATDTSSIVGGDLQLRALEAQDFIGIHDARIEFDGHGVYALNGPNGSGKSTMGIETIRYALFGESRAGAKMADRLIRHGADLATAAVELEDAQGTRYRVVRKTKNGSRGPVTTLDVLSSNGNGWSPLSTGKIASGEAEISKILGDLSLDTLTAANLAPQRGADRFTRARSEERKSLLAQAAGLQVYDLLSETTRAQMVVAERMLDRQQAIALPLRPRAAAVTAIEAEITRARGDVEQCRGRVAQAERAREEVVEQLAQAQATLARTEDAKGTIKKLEAELGEINGEIATWDRKREIAEQILADRAKYEGAKTALADMRASIALLEGDQAREQDQQLAHDRAEYQALEKTGRLDALRATRVNDARALDRQIKDAEKRVEMLASAECCSVEEVCVFLVDARAARDSITALEERLAPLSEPGDEEGVLVGEIINIPVPPAPTTSAETIRNLRFARLRAGQLEQDIQVGEKIARAEAVVAEHADAVAKLRTRRDAAALALTGAKASHDAYLAALGEVTRLGEKRTVYGGQIEAERRTLTVVERDVAFAEGRLSEARAAADELAKVKRAITAAAADVATWKDLGIAWKACRVLTLESSVIPAVEDTANEILKQFRHGMQLRFSTQREKRDGSQGETLDVEVEGGRGELYEMCSGGEQTTLDFACHIAIALVVARRSAMRLKFLVTDEPEGLDEANRAAFASAIRWVNETYGLTCVVMSHAPDLIDALGGQVIHIVPGVDGSTIEVGA
jgi:exonuclease SbcD